MDSSLTSDETAAPHNPPAYSGVDVIRVAVFARLKMWFLHWAYRLWPEARAAKALMAAPVQVEIIEFEDASEPGDPHGYYYKGRVYRASVDGHVLTLRSYDDEPGRVSFLSLDDELFTRRTVRHPALRRIEVHFRGLGFKTFAILYGPKGYRDL